MNPLTSTLLSTKQCEIVRGVKDGMRGASIMAIAK
jgi:hypothetical protein